MSSNFDISLEMPICKEDASRRKFAPDICKLIVRFNETSQLSKDLQLQALAELLFSWRNPGEILAAQPINLFKSLNYTGDLLSKEGIEHEMLSNFSVSIICRKSGEPTFVMRCIEAEAVVFFFVSEFAQIRKIENRIMKIAPTDNQYERPYLADLSDCDGFVFYADSHLSFEVLGSREMVTTRCLSRLLPKCLSKF
jgi:hypothetical protein